MCVQNQRVSILKKRVKFCANIRTISCLYICMYFYIYCLPDAKTPLKKKKTKRKKYFADDNA